MVTKKKLKDFLFININSWHFFLTVEILDYVSKLYRTKYFIVHHPVSLENVHFNMINIINFIFDVYYDN